MTLPLGQLHEWRQPAGGPPALVKPGEAQSASGPNNNMSFTVPAGTKLLLVRATWLDNNKSGENITGIKWGTVSLTQLCSTIGTNGSRTMQAAIFYLWDPAPGVNTLALTGTSGGDGNRMYVECWKDVTGFGATAGANNTTNSSSVSVNLGTTPSVPWVGVVVGAVRVGSAFTPGTNVTEEDDINVNYNSSPYQSFCGKSTTTTSLSATSGASANTHGSAGAILLGANSPGPSEASKPFSLVAPIILGPYSVGRTLGVTTGEWRGTTPMSFAYQWLRDGVDISGATSSSYLMVAADYSTMITCRVTATNMHGTGSAVSNPFGPVGGLIPSNTVLPNIAGSANIGATLTCNPGTWNGVPVPTFSYQWLLNGTAISGATGSAYIPVAGDKDKKISCRVRGVNEAGEATATSAEVGPIGEAVAVPPQYVGGMSGSTTGGTGGMAPSFALTGGIDTVPRKGDLVVVSQHWANRTQIGFTFMANADPGRGYTEVAAVYANDTYDTNLYVGYKFMGDVPDTFVDFGANNDATSAQVYAIHVWRGVDPDNPLDVASISIAKTNTHFPTPADIAITPVSPHTVALFIMAAATQGGSVYTNGTLGNLQSAFGNSTQDAVIGMGSLPWNGSGSMQPGSWGFTGVTSTTTANSHAAVSLVLRPVNTTGPAGIFCVGHLKGQNGGTVGTRTVPLTGFAGGFRSKLKPGDLVFLILADVVTVNLQTARTVYSAGWTAQTPLYVNEGRDCNMQMFWKVMGAVPDVDVTFDRASDANDGAYLIYAISGTDSSWSDANGASATGIDIGRPNPPAVTPVTPGAAILAVGATTGGTGEAVALTSSDLSSFFEMKEDDGSSVTMIGAGMTMWSGSGAFDPVAMGGGSPSTSDGWVARTLALRPKPIAAANTSLPVISGAMINGTAQCSTGTWTGTNLTFTYQWYKNGLILSGQTANTYAVVAEDAGQTLTCKVTATNSLGSAEATSGGVVVSDVGPIQFVGATQPVVGTSIAIPAHQAGDLILITVDSAGSAVTLPAGWTQIAKLDNVLKSLWAYKIATDGNTVSGTWANAYTMDATVYRNAVIGGIGGPAASNNWQALTCQDQSGKSWVVGSGHSAGTAAGPTMPAGKTQRSAGNYHRLWDTNGGVTSVNSQPGPAASDHVIAIELKNALPVQYGLIERNWTEWLSLLTDLYHAQ